MTATNQNRKLAPDQLPPCNIDAEEEILGGIILDFDAIARIAETLPPEAFFLDGHRTIYQAALHLHSKGQTTDLMSLTAWLHDHGQLENVGGQSKLAQLLERTVSSINIDRYAQLVLEKYQRRKLIDLGYELTQLALDSFRSLDNVLEQAQEKATNIISSPFAQKISPSEHRYNRLVDEVSKVVTEVVDVGFRSFRMHELAKKYGLSPKNLEDIYFKYLVNKDDEPFQSFGEMLSKYGNKEQDWLIQGILPKASTVLIHALGGTGKTRLTYDLAYSLLRGENWNGFPVTARQRKGLFIQTDESPEHMLRTLSARGFDTTLNIKFKTRWTMEHLAALRTEIERSSPDFILIDNLATVNRHSIFSENDVEYARPILLLNELAREFGITIIIVHHSSKGGSSRGTTAINNSVDYVIKLERDPNHSSPDAPERLLTFEKARTRRPAQYQLLFNPDNSSWAVVGEAGEDPNGLSGKTKDKITQFLEARRNTVYEAVELHHELGSSYDNIRRAAAQLASDGVISRRQLGKRGSFGYFIPGEANSPEQEDGLIQLGDNKCDRVWDGNEKRDRICDNQNEEKAIGNLPEANGCDADSTEVLAETLPPHLPDHADHVGDHEKNDHQRDHQQCPAGNPLPEQFSQSVITDHAKNAVFHEDKKSEKTTKTRSANVEPAPSAPSEVITFADRVADRFLDDQQNDQQTEPVQEDVWQVGDRVCIKSVPKKQPKSFIGKVGVITALSMAGLRVKVGNQNLTLDPEQVDRLFKTEAPGAAPQRYRYRENRPKRGDFLTSAYYGKTGIITAVHSNSPMYEVTWDDNKKTRHDFADFELLEITYERDK